MPSGIRSSHILALAIIGGVAAWMYTGDVVIGGVSDSGVEATSPAERNAEAAEKPFRVGVTEITAADRRVTLEIRGRTRADLRVEVRAETAGQVEERPVTEGQRVAAGDVLCKLENGTREARLLQAEAQLAQAELSHTAADTLSQKGYSARTTLRAARAALDAARAAVAEAKLEIERTTIRAPIAGVIHEPYAEVGDMLAIGGTCATILDADPMLMTGQVSERDVGALKTGMTAKVSLVTGEEITGTIRYIAPAADEKTRTFRVDIEMANDDGALRDGVTALAEVQLEPTRAHLISPSILTLADDGTVGVRVIEDGNTVAFLPVRILGSGTEGVWVGGLPETVPVITVGQDYVRAGAKVEPVFETAEAK
ncbi:efflux RND transporter periplasmic adaptor subunit [Rhodobium gokarnense]|uniref:Multidrug efflux system membrane fusion protein n=1 Tax=Rhodobium gokarnense TaxID=364296 RepID=A0ABT3HAR1_9HYPH|nr:efflux RND transporter periplasmic adaptor subunit [Rhodobium gokarnense]MCW2307444.1 multidrug efflux system membrane fusion protein [Rhodobium gokarnense]